MELQIIKEQEILGKQFKMYGTVQTPLFLAKDVAEWVDYSKTSQGYYNTSMMLSKIDEDEKIKMSFSTINNADSRKNNLSTDVWMLTEQGLYEVLMQSRKPIAKEFKKEVKAILKQIRLTGGYVQTDREEEFIDKYFPSFTEDTKLTMIHDLRNQNKQYKEQISQLEPQANAFKDLMTAQGYLPILDVCGCVNKSRSSLFQFLIEKKVLTKQSGHNVPYERFKKNNMFKTIISKKNGHFYPITVVSPLGLIYIYKLLKKNDMLDEFNSSLLLEMQDLEVSA